MSKFIDEYIGYKVRLFPTKQQQKILYSYFAMNRFVYNLVIDIEEKHYNKYKAGEEKYKRKKYFELNALMTKLKQDKYIWLNNYNAESIKSAIKDCIVAYDKFDDESLFNGFPRFKSKVKSKKQFSVRADRLEISDNEIMISSIGKIKYCNSYGDEIIGSGNKNKVSKIRYLRFLNSRISFDGNYFYLSFSLEKDKTHQINSYWKYSNNEQWQEQESSEAIGIDVGLKRNKWFKDSTGHTVVRPDSTVLNNKIGRLTRKYQRQKKLNIKKNSSFMEQHPNGSKNMQKTLDKINKCYKKISNRRRNEVYEYSKFLLEKKPKTIVLESISVSEVMIHDNKEYNYHKAKINGLIQDAAIYESTKIIERKMINNGIPVIYADPHYPSSQLCSCCGYRQDIGRKNIYRCPECGNIIDRDFNAAINLAKLAY